MYYTFNCVCVYLHTYVEVRGHHAPSEDCPNLRIQAAAVLELHWLRLWVGCLSLAEGVRKLETRNRHCYLRCVPTTIPGFMKSAECNPQLSALSHHHSVRKSIQSQNIPREREIDTQPVFQATENRSQHKIWVTTIIILVGVMFAVSVSSQWTDLCQ